MEVLIWPVCLSRKNRKKNHHERTGDKVSRIAGKRNNWHSLCSYILYIVYKV